MVSAQKKCKLLFPPCLDILLHCLRRCTVHTSIFISLCQCQICDPWCVFRVQIQNMDMNYTFLHFDLSEIITLLIYNCKNLTGPLILIMSALAIVVLALVISLYSDLASLCLCRHWDWTLDNAFSIFCGWLWKSQLAFYYIDNICNNFIRKIHLKLIRFEG